jgi:hypothetical protein
VLLLLKRLKSIPFDLFSISVLPAEDAVAILSLKTKSFDFFLSETRAKDLND